MADEDQKDLDEAEDAEGEEGEEGGKKKGSKKLLLIIVLAVVIIGAAGGGAFFYLQNQEDGKNEGHKEGAEGLEEGHGAPAAAEGVFYDLPEILVNLAGSGSVPRYLKIKLTLEVGSEADLPFLTKVQPRIVDDFQVYLRQLRPEDLQGSAGVFRLKEALLLRANQAAQPLEIQNVLFTEMLVQ